MKRIFVFLPALCLCLALCACGSKLTPPAPALTPTPSAPVAPPIPEAPVPAGSSDAPQSVFPIVGAAPKDSLPAPYFVMVRLGEGFIWDFDRDGRPETVCVDTDGSDTVLALTVNGAPQLRLELDCPDTFWAVVDIDAADGILEVAVQDWGPSSDLRTIFFRITQDDKGLSVTNIGEVEGLIWAGRGHGDVNITGDGSVHTVKRLRVLQTWFARCIYLLIDGVLEEQWTPEYYPFHATAVTTRCELTAYLPPYGSETCTLPAGTHLSIYGTDDVEWLYCTLPDQSPVLLHLDAGSGMSLETPDGYVYGWDAMDGLLFAD